MMYRKNKKQNSTKIVASISAWIGHQVCVSVWVCGCVCVCECVYVYPCRIHSKNMLFRIRNHFAWAWHSRTSGPLSKWFLWCKVFHLPLNLRAWPGWSLAPGYGNGISIVILKKQQLQKSKQCINLKTHVFPHVSSSAVIPCDCP